MRHSILLGFSLLLCAAAASAQQPVMAGRVLLKIKPEAIADFRIAFESPATNDRTFDAQRFALKDPPAISALLQLPASFHVLSIKPLIPQHNVVLEHLREHTNPTLFSVTSQDAAMAVSGEQIQKLRQSEENVSRWFELFYSDDLSPEAVALILKKSQRIECSEPRYRNSLCFTPNDPLFGQQYSLPLIHAPQAWDIVKCDSSMLVADADIGTDWTHPDLAAAIFINQGETGIDADGLDKRANGIDDDGDGFIDDWHGWDFAGNDGTSPDNDPNTTAVHGTHTAGIMAASGNNGIGMTGVAFGAKLIPIKCGDNGGQDVSFGYEGIVYAADMGAKVVNNSWGGSNRSQVGQDIVNYANAKDCAVVAASGNDGQNEADRGVLEYLYPAAYDHVLGVAAVDASARVADFSNYNTRVDVCAPGSAVISTVPGAQYSSLSGTSMASPTAAGGVALVRQKYPFLTADQAMERLRVTADAMDVNHDTHPGYNGTGLIDLEQAVKTGDSPLFSARLESVEIVDPDTNGALESGEQADIILHVRNYLGSLGNLVSKIEFLDTNHYITSNAQTVAFGKANTLELVQNFQGSFHVTVSGLAPNNYSVLVKLTFVSQPDGYGPDIDYFSLVINGGYLNLNKNNLGVSFDSRGNIGYSDPPNNTQGLGFIWTNPPSDIAALGRNLLSEAGLMIGGDVSHLAAAAPSPVSDLIPEQDFLPSLNINYISPAEHTNAIQELHSIIADVNLDSTVQAGVRVDEKMYAFTKDLSANAVVLDYVVHKRTANVNDLTAAGLFMDWDIGPSGSINKAYISGVDTAIAVVRRMEDFYPFVGIKLISAIPSGASMNIYALDNDGSNGSATTYGGFSQDDKWTSLTTPRSSAGIGDVSVVYSVKDIPLLTLDSVRLTYIIALAENEQLLKQTIDGTLQQWLVNSAVRSAPNENIGVTCSPNPFGNRLHISWTSTEPEAEAQIDICDPLGRIVFTRKTFGDQVELGGLVLPAGAYSVLIHQGKLVLSCQTICLP